MPGYSARNPWADEWIGVGGRVITTFFFALDAYGVVGR